MFLKLYPKSEYSLGSAFTLVQVVYIGVAVRPELTQYKSESSHVSAPKTSIYLYWSTNFVRFRVGCSRGTYSPKNYEIQLGAANDFGKSAGEFIGWDSRSE